MSVRTETVLATILATTQASVAAAKSLVPLAELERRALGHRPRGWTAALRQDAHRRVAGAAGAEGMERRPPAFAPAIIAEIKKASPSKGLIRADFDPEWLARRYRAGGAAALSVLTDEPFFQGSLRNLELASAAVPLPCLRKDFLTDEYQIVEARAHRADAVLLIAAALDNAQLKRLAEVARGFSLDVLVEVHTAEELDRVLETGIAATGGTSSLAIGVNHRDLRTFDVNLEISLELAERIPAGVVRVAESGIAGAADIARLAAAGFDAFLIGESLMRQPDPGAALAELIAAAAGRPALEKRLLEKRDEHKP